MIKNSDLFALKGKIKNIEDLRKIAVLEQFDFNEEELQSTYNAIMSMDSELAEADLENINGGRKIPAGPQEYPQRFDYVRYYCIKCNGLIWFPSNSEVPYPCPLCGKKQRYNRKQKDC